MPKSPNQKLKLLYLMQLLLEKTDAQHPVSMEEIIRHLAANDIAAERKSLYDDIEALRRFGLDIGMTKAKPGGYYLASRDFELAELKLLVDSVQASQFITERKTLQLIKKLESLCSVHEARLIRRQVVVSGRIKHMNESIYYSVDAIHNGIAEDRQISFRYFEYTVAKRKSYRHGGKTYVVSPYALMWDNENYYLIAYDAEAGRIKHYRVDRMESIAVTEHSREGKEAFDAHDMGMYTHKNFSMFGGEEMAVTMVFDNALVGVVLDRFGKSVPITKVDDAHFRITAQVAVSPQFYGWLFGLGTAAKVLAPAAVVDGMQKMLADVARGYGEETPHQ